MKIQFTPLLLLAALLLTGCKTPKNNYGFFEEHRDIGACALKGDFSYDMVKDEYLITGSGENIWFGKDQFHFAWFMEDEDIGMRAKIQFVGTGKNPHRKAGWMFRNALDSTAAHISATIHGDGLTGIQYRPYDGADMQEVKAGASGPLYIQFTRQGDTYELVTGSVDGITDTIVLVSAAIAQEYYTGLFICSHDNSVRESALISRLEVWGPGKTDMVPFSAYIEEDKGESGMLSEEDHCLGKGEKELQRLSYSFFCMASLKNAPCLVGL